MPHYKSHRPPSTFDLSVVAALSAAVCGMAAVVGYDLYPGRDWQAFGVIGVVAALACIGCLAHLSPTARFGIKAPRWIIQIVRRNRTPLIALGLLAACLSIAAAKSACAQNKDARQTPSRSKLPPQPTHGQRIADLERQVSEIWGQLDAIQSPENAGESNAAAAAGRPANVGAGNQTPPTTLQPLTNDGKPRCQGIVRSKNRQCKMPSEPKSRFCKYHAD